LGELKRFFGDIPLKNRFKSPKNSILGEGQFAKKFEYFPGKLTVGAINLSRFASKRILKIDYFLED